MRCEKCEKDKKGPWMGDASCVKLEGNYWANLCTQCHNAWTEYIDTHEAYARKIALCAERDWLFAPIGDGGVLLNRAAFSEHWQMNHQVGSDLFAIAKAWVAEPLDEAKDETVMAK